LTDSEASSSTQPVSLTRPGSGTGRHDEVDFAPSDLTDGRQENDWRSRYGDRRATVQIAAESAYLGVLIIAAAMALILIWLGTPRSWLGVSELRYATFRVYAFAWVSGTLGGTLFAVKWLYHTVGKGFWHVDRFAWRLFTPHLSGGFSFGLIALATSGVFEILNRELLRSSPAVVGTAFILGYFSDFTVARLYKVAKHLLGSSHNEDAHDSIREPDRA
jgi:hypothetical protein